MKNIKIFTAFILLFAIFISISVSTAPKALAATDPDIKANAVLLAEASTGKILYEKNLHEKVYPASVTKIMTALLAIIAIEDGNASLDDVITVKDDAYYDVIDESSTQHIEIGEEITLKDLLYCALVSSANEACNIIAEYIAGDIQTFISQMNSYAQELGCTDTNFMNTHGLPDDNHYTSAWDLYLIANEAITHPLFMTIIGTATYTTAATNMTDARELINTNKLIVPDSGYYYEYALGGKTGSTEKAGYCLLCTAEKDGLRLISIVMGAQSVDLEDGTKEVQSFPESKRLFEWGFSSFSYRTILDTTDLIKEIAVSMGDGAESVILRPETSIVALLDNDVDISTFSMDVTVYNEEANEELLAPISAGEVLGEVAVYDGDTNYGTVKLVANTSVDRQMLKYMTSEIKSVLSSTWFKLIVTAVVILFALYIAYIIRYNISRRKAYKLAAEESLKKSERLRKERGVTTGKTFEELERDYNDTIDRH